MGNSLELHKIQPFPSRQINDWAKFKGSADDPLIFAQAVLKFIFDKLENILGKGENVNIQRFLLFP